MKTFRRSYIVSLVMLGVFFVPAAISSLLEGISGIGLGLIGLSLVAVPLVPLFCKGGIAGHPKLAAGIAAGLAVLSGHFVGTVYYNFFTHGLEGPNGEGSPIGSILITAVAAFWFFCPWLLTALRGASFFKNQKEAQQAGSYDDG
jgi:hypothetical protein